MKWVAFPAIALTALCVLGTSQHSRAASEKDAEEARRSLRKEGLKTDLSDFDFSTDPATAARAAALTNAIISRPAVLLQGCGVESAVVAWKGTNFQEEAEGYQSLPSVEQTLTNQANLDLACTAALAGPIHFPLMANHGSAMLLVHLATLKSISQALAARAILDLRDKRYSQAWTNLLAVTRLAAAWEPEPSEISHLVRFNLARNAWKAAWQALQAHQWSEEQLLALQREWEAPDFFKGLPETAAFQGACMVDVCIRERTNSSPGPPLKNTLQNAIQSPASVVNDAKYRWQRMQYHTSGTYEDERDLLLFYRDREMELRKAIRLPTWLEMRNLPGAANSILFRSKHVSQMQMMLNTRQLSVGWQSQGKTLLGHAAETEARRRLVVAAIGLERYRLAHGTYPKDLQSLAPDVLKNIPVDFMDGKPLRYRLAEPASFVLHSVGLDCVDDGGKLSVANQLGSQYMKPDAFDAPDLVWPAAASDAETEDFHLAQVRAKEEQRKKWQQDAQDREKEHEDQRQAIIANLAAICARDEAPEIPDPEINGGPLSQVLRNKALPGPPPLIARMLTLHAVATAKEPDIVTFELPISYDALTNVGWLRLLCDAAPADNGRDDGAEAQNLERATNGNCRLVWNTMYDPPGKHFLQAQLSVSNSRAHRPRSNYEPHEIRLKGPLFAFVSTNVLQYTPMGDVYSEQGASFYVKLAQKVGSYSLELTSPSGQHLHTITGSTTNGIVETNWDLICDDGLHYTNNSLNSTWTVTFPDPPRPASPAGTNAP
jgi:hypothetical protein